MSARPLDIAPPGPISYPDSGLGRGWEAGAMLGLTLLLLSVGLVTLYSASSVYAMRQSMPDSYYALRQAAGAGFGMGLFMVCAFTPYTLWRRTAWILAGGTAFLLLLCVLPWTHSIAPEIKGARRWLDLGVRFQPSEIAKITMVVWTAAMAVRKAPEFSSLRRGLGPFLVVWSVIVGLVMAEPDFSTAILLTLLGVVIVFSAGARVGHFVFLGLLSTPVVLLQLREGFRVQRMQAFLNPLEDPDGAGYQVVQSLVAFGSGGINGVGFGEGRQKHGFLPESHNDFIFAMIGEEWGLIGVILLIGLYAAMILVGFRIAARAPDFFGELLAIGFTSLLALQAVLHMAVGLSLAPATGLALPLVSYGRSNLVVTLMALGILVSVARAAPGGKAARG